MSPSIGSSAARAVRSSASSLASTMVVIGRFFPLTVGAARHEWVGSAAAVRNRPSCCSTVNSPPSPATRCRSAASPLSSGAVVVVTLSLTMVMLDAASVICTWVACACRRMFVVVSRSTCPSSSLARASTSASRVTRTRMPAASNRFFAFSISAVRLSRR